MQFRPFLFSAHPGDQGAGLVARAMCDGGAEEAERRGDREKTDDRKFAHDDLRDGFAWTASRRQSIIAVTQRSRYRRLLHPVVGKTTMLPLGMRRQ